MVKVREKFTAALEDGSLGDSMDRAGGNGAAGSRYVESPIADGGAVVAGRPDWLDIARKSYHDSTRYVDANLRAQWENNDRMFNGRHIAGSKFYSDSFKSRSKLFRPKTRAASRQAEAACAASFFASQDVVSVRAKNADDPRQHASAILMKELLNYRMTTPDNRVGIPWFMTLVGAYQDARKYGIVASYQSWLYEERTKKVLHPARDKLGNELQDENGDPKFEELSHQKILIDRPEVRLIPPENIRIDRSADWRDPVATSPFVIVMWPMYIRDVEARMVADNTKTGAKPWHKVDRATLKTARTEAQYDATRITREGNRQDSKESEIGIEEFQIVWVHENFVKWAGEDYTYFTAGTSALLSDPIPVEEAHPALAGMRPLVLGCALIETHNAHPSGLPQLTQGLQQEANEIVNLRLDNVKLAMNKRHFVRRGAQVDLLSLLRNSPGSTTLVNDVEKDVKVVETRDVTSGAYMEQDRINIDFDSVAGQFDAGTVQSNRRMNETVGGMQMIQGAGHSVGELDLRVFTVTWCERVLHQIVRLEQYYENDEAILSLAGASAQLFQKFHIDTVTDELLEGDLTLTVNVGIGAADPMQRIQRFQMATEIVGKLLGPVLMWKMNPAQIIAEVFGLAGYRDGMRFFTFDNKDPTVDYLTQELQYARLQAMRRGESAQARVESAKIAGDSRIMAQQIMAEGRENEARIKKLGDLTGEQIRSNTNIRQETMRFIAALRQYDSAQYDASQSSPV